MNKTLIINAGIGEVRIATIVDSVPTQVAFLRDHEPSLLGQEYFARVLRVASELDGAFLDMGKFQAFLPRRNIKAKPQEKTKAINSIINEGEMLKVKISRDPVPSDNKLAITTQIKSEIEIGTKPSAATDESHFIHQVLSWAGYENISDIIVDDLDVLTAIKKQLKSKNGAYNISHHKDNQSIFMAFGVEDKLSEIIDNKISLPSGGWITLEGTSALTAIDVNGGSSGQGRIASDNALKINLEAATAIASALQLQNIGGLIVVDFLDMRGKQAKETLEGAIKKALTHDPLHVECGKISPFGLFEIKRQRQGEGLRERMVQKNGALRPDYVALNLLRQALALGLEPSSGKIEISSPQEVISWLQKHEALSINLSKQTARDVVLNVGGADTGTVEIIS